MKIVQLFFGSHIVGKSRAYNFFVVLNKKYENVALYTLNGKESVFRRIIFEIKTIIKLFNKEVKIIHLHDFSLILPFFIKILKYNKKIVIYDTGNIHYETAKITNQKKVIVKIIKFLENITIKQANYIISRGVFLKHIIEVKRGNNIDIYYIPDPVNVELFKKIKQEEARKKLGIPKEKFLIGYTANFTSIKVGPKFLPRGWELIEILIKFKKKNISNINVIFIGSGKGLVKLKELAYKKGVESFCVFTDKVPEKKFIYYLKAIDVGFMEDYDNIQYKTSIGAKVQEYMAAGKIVVTGNNPERDFLLSSSQGTRFFFTPPDIENDLDIEKYIEQIWNIFWDIYINYDDIKYIGINNEKRATEIFDYPVVNESLIELYEKILSKDK